MTVPASPRDLVILTADKNCQFALRGLMTRSRSLRIRTIDPEMHVHPDRDPGVLGGAHKFLRPFVRTHRYALVVLDREGCGKETSARDELELEIERNLQASGWDQRGRAIVIDPELEIWVWSDSPHVAGELGWTSENPELRTWLEAQGYLSQGALKPIRPKEALDAVLRKVRTPRSSAIYKSLAEKVGLSRCTDPAFQKLRATLQEWFPEA
jgi:hypothetical protein